MVQSNNNESDITHYFLPQMKDKSVLERYPYLFKLESGDMPWYESMGFKKGQDVYIPELEKGAKEFINNYYVEPLDKEEFDVNSEKFKRGACWYMSNYHILKTLSNDKYGNAVVIAQILHAKEECAKSYPDEEWTIYDAIDFVISEESIFVAGVEWAEKQSKCITKCQVRGTA